MTFAESLLIFEQRPQEPHALPHRARGSTRTLFYLRSRGITRPVAEKMLVTAFLEEVLNRVPLKNVVKYLDNVIADKAGAPNGFNRIRAEDR